VEVLADPRGEHRGDVVVGERFDGERDDAVAAGDDGGPLLVGPPVAFEVRAGEQRHDRVVLPQPFLHALHEVVAGAPVPHVEHDLVAVALQVVAHPLGPRAVGARVTDEVPLCGAGHRAPRVTKSRT
jgi:hypothetical protein